MNQGTAHEKKQNKNIVLVKKKSSTLKFYMEQRNSMVYYVTF